MPVNTQSAPRTLRTQRWLCCCWPVVCPDAVQFHIQPVNLSDRAPPWGAHTEAGDHARWLANPFPFSKGKQR